jgi:hypothetical protein
MRKQGQETTLLFLAIALPRPDPGLHSPKKNDFLPDYFED